jgi:hypothetical protein
MSKIDWIAAKEILDRAYKKALQETELNKKLVPKSSEYKKSLEKNLRKYAEAEKTDLKKYGNETVTEFERFLEIYVKEEIAK